MKKWVFISVLFASAFLVPMNALHSQCSICTKTAQQLGEKPAKALNKGIIYLAFTPLVIVGVIGYRWWRSNREL